MMLVTGVPRSGTTPLGHFMEEFCGFPVIHEPFNNQTGIESISEYFQFASADEQEKLFCLIERVRRYDVTFKAGLFAGESRLRSLAKIIYGSKTKSSFRRSRANGNQKCLTLKDPFLCLSVEPCLRQFEKVFITIRKPEGICSSFETYQWYFPEVFRHSWSDLESLIDIPVMQAFGCAQFNALAVQYEFYKRLDTVKDNSAVIILNMSKVPADPECGLFPFREAISSYVPDDFMSKVFDFYTKESGWKSRITVHNHAQGVNKLVSKGAGWAVKPEYQRLFEVVKGHYEGLC